MEWKPAETAPTDGTVIDVWDRVYGVRIIDVYYDEENECFTSTFTPWSGSFSHWFKVENPEKENQS